MQSKLQTEPRVSPKRLLLVGALLILLTACATVLSDPPGFDEATGCPIEVPYSETFLRQAAEEFEALPEGPIKEMITDYRILRAQTRACRGVTQ